MTNEQLALYIDLQHRTLVTITDKLKEELDGTHGVDRKNFIAPGTHREVPVLDALEQYIDDLKTHTDVLANGEGTV